MPMGHGSTGPCPIGTCHLEHKSIGHATPGPPSPLPHPARSGARLCRSALLQEADTICAQRALTKATLFLCAFVCVQNTELTWWLHKCVCVCVVRVCARVVRVCVYAWFVCVCVSFVCVCVCLCS